MFTPVHIWNLVQDTGSQYYTTQLVLHLRKQNILEILPQREVRKSNPVFLLFSLKHKYSNPMTHEDL